MRSPVGRKVGSALIVGGIGTAIACGSVGGDGDDASGCGSPSLVGSESTSPTVPSSLRRSDLVLVKNVPESQLDELRQRSAGPSRIV